MKAQRHFVGALWIALACLIPAAAGAAQLIVVEARGIGFAPGTTVDSSKPMVLKAGQHVTLISPSGATIKLDGPYNQAPDMGQGNGVDLKTKLAALVAGGQRTGEVGTTRGTVRQPLPSPWLLDISRAGTVCLLDGDQKPVLWHPAPAKDSNISLMPTDRSWRADIIWPANQERLEIPNVPLHGGVTYLVSISGDQRAIIVSMVPAALANDDMRTAWMVNKGCEQQAEALSRQVR